jgi:hypothetical protein
MFLRKGDSIVYPFYDQDQKIPKTRNAFRNDLYQDWETIFNYSILQIRSKTQPRGLFIVKVGIKL